MKIDTATKPNPEKQPPFSDFRLFTLRDGDTFTCSECHNYENTFKVSISESAITLTCTGCKAKTVAIASVSAL